MKTYFNVPISHWKEAQNQAYMVHVTLHRAFNGSKGSKINDLLLEKQSKYRVLTHFTLYMLAAKNTF